MRSPLSVILVDDRADIRSLVAEALGRDRRLQVVGEAPSGRTGVALAATVRPDMALVDLAMPDGDGFEALRRLRAEVPATKVVLYSGFERAPLWPKLAVDGAVGYLQKGIGAAQLPRDVLALAGALDAVGAVLTHYETELAPERASVRDARRSLQKLDLPCDGDDLTLLTSELVSNALEHGSGRPRLVVQVGTDELRVEVHDDSRVLPRLRAPSEDRPGGRGLHLVQQVALAWGAEFRPSGKAVWFTLPVSVPA